MDAVHQKLGDLRSKLDTVPVLQQAEVSYSTQRIDGEAMTFFLHRNEEKPSGASQRLVRVSHGRRDDVLLAVG